MKNNAIQKLWAFGERVLCILSAISMMWMVVVFLLKKANMSFFGIYVAFKYTAFISFIMCVFFYFIIYVSSSLSRNVLEIKNMKTNAANFLGCWTSLMAIYLVNSSYLDFNVGIATVLSIAIFSVVIIFLSKTIRYFLLRKPTYIY